MIHSVISRIRKVIAPILVPVHPAGYPFIALFAAFNLLMYSIALPLGILGSVVVLWCVYFFRDPPRHTPTCPGLIISPADGIVAEVAEVDIPSEIPLPYRRGLKIGVFMNVFDVHVNRAPITGKITDLRYFPGSFLDASLEKASYKNERQMVMLNTDWCDADGHSRDVAFVQIAGLVARRIICTLQLGDHVSVGERFGLIRFGSRVDVYLPADAAIATAVGQRMLAGQTVLAHLATMPERGWPKTVCN